MNFRKQLLDAESELQMLVRRLGTEAAAIIDGESGGMDRLTVPLLKKDGTYSVGCCRFPVAARTAHPPFLSVSAPSATETTEISSLCSLNSSQDDEYFADGSQPGQQTPGPRKRPSVAKKATFEGDNKAKQESILRKEQRQQQQRTRFSDQASEEDRSKAKIVSFGPSDHKPETRTKSEQNLEKLGITQIHPKPREEPESKTKPKEPQLQQQQPPPHTYQDIQEMKIQEVTSLLTSQLLKKHDEQFNYENLRRRSSVKSVNLNENLSCHVEHRRTSVPNWSTNKMTAKKNSKNAERRYAEDRSWHEERRPVCAKHGVGGYIEFSSSDKETYGSDYEGFGSERDIYSNGSYQNFGFRASQEGLGGSGGLKYIDKDEYWVTPQDPLSRKGSGSQKGRISPYLLKENVNNVPSPNAPPGAADAAQNQGECKTGEFPAPHGLGGVSSHLSPRGLSDATHRSSIRCKSRDSETTRSQTSAREPKQPTKPRTNDQSGGGKQVNSGFGTNLTHVLSTPDVAAIRPFYDSKTFDIYGTEKRSKGQKSKQGMGSGPLCAAVSEGELLDLSILPIFHKLLTERHKSRTGYGASIASCPNISIKCDIVEYL